MDGKMYTTNLKGERKWVDNPPVNNKSKAYILTDPNEIAALNQSMERAKKEYDLRHLMLTDLGYNTMNESLIYSLYKPYFPEDRKIIITTEMYESIKNKYTQDKESGEFNKLYEKLKTEWLIKETEEYENAKKNFTSLVEKYISITDVELKEKYLRENIIYINTELSHMNSAMHRVYNDNLDDVIQI